MSVNFNFCIREKNNLDHWLPLDFKIWRWIKIVTNPNRDAGGVLKRPRPVEEPENFLEHVLMCLPNNVSSISQALLTRNILKLYFRYVRNYDDR